jgi:hypothetical protein
MRPWRIMSNAAVQRQGVSKRFSQDDIIPYHGLRTKIHGLFRRDAGRLDRVACFGPCAT